MKVVNQLIILITAIVDVETLSYKSSTFLTTLSAICAKFIFKLFFFQRLNLFWHLKPCIYGIYTEYIQEDKSLGGPKITGLQNYCLKNRLCDASIVGRYTTIQRNINQKNRKDNYEKNDKYFLKRTLKTRPIWWEVYNEAAYTRKYNINETNIK